MNHIVLIGNGFDLAHGLKTSYHDFIYWYLNDILGKVEMNLNYSDSLIKITSKNMELNGGFTQPYNTHALQKGRLTTDLVNYQTMLTLHNFTFQFTSPFSNKLLDTSIHRGWVDIENLYYSQLQEIYKNYQVHGSYSNSIKNLNDSFSGLIRKFTEYLNLIETDKIDYKIDIQKHLAKMTEKFGVSDYLLFLNFNYTNTIEKYMSIYDSPNISINYIHGKLNELNNPIIFGYGDETDSFYETLEKLNDNALLKFAKSFGYAHTQNYQNLSSFIESGDYNVHIMGHSCGLSDRVLLKQLFEDDNCKKINIYYYQKSNEENDFINKYMDISRHFSIDKKASMRIKITSYEKSVPFVTFNS